MLSSQIIDAIIFIYLGYAVVIGFKRGFFNVLVGIFGIYGASFLAWVFQYNAFQMAVSIFGISPNINTSIVFVFVWILFYFVAIVVAKLLTGIFNLTGISFFLRLSGAIFNAIKAVLIVVVVLTFISNLNKDLFEPTRVTEVLIMVGSKVMNLYSDSVNENVIDVIKEPGINKDSFIIDDDFRYNLLER